MLPYLEAAYNLASWLVNSHEADDIVQESFLKAFRHFDGYRDGNSKAWLLTIVRNTAYSWLKKNRQYDACQRYEDETGPDTVASGCYLDPEEWLVIQSDLDRLYRVLDKMPLKYREIIVLREIEECDYRQISEILEIAPGTVMSRLSRARHMLNRMLRDHQSREAKNEL